MDKLRKGVFKPEINFFSRIIIIFFLFLGLTCSSKNIDRGSFEVVLLERIEPEPELKPKIKEKRAKENSPRKRKRRRKKRRKSAYLQKGKRKKEKSLARIFRLTNQKKRKEKKAASLKDESSEKKGKKQKKEAAKSLKEIFQAAKEEEKKNRKDREKKKEKEVLSSKTPLSIEEDSLSESTSETAKLSEQSGGDMFFRKRPLSEKEKKLIALARRVEEKKKEYEESNLKEFDNSRNFSSRKKGKKFASSWTTPAKKIGKGRHPYALELANLPKDKYGLVDWALTTRKGLIAPVGGLTPEARKKEEFEERSMVIMTGTTFNDVVFPHDMHSYWLNCQTCHEQIFIKKSWANPITMMKNKAGKYCGRCHGKVAFPLRDCKRCHVLPKVNFPY